MRNVIFYFTGTGNSLAVARDIADKIGDTKIVAIADAIKENNIDLPYERVGFVFPVYYYCTPSIVKRFIKKLNFNKSQYVFGVITYGGTYGETLSQLEHCIREQGGLLSAGFSVRMPGNYIVKYGAFIPTIQRMIFKREKNRVSGISTAVKAREKTHIAKGSLISRAFSGSIQKIIADFGKNAQNFHVNSKCTGCGSCEKICPVGNINIENRQPKWGNTCEQCMACIQWCPLQAIEYADKTAKRRRYQHPEIKILDLISNSTGNSTKLE